MSKHLKNSTKAAKRFPRLTLTTVLVATAVLAIAAVTVVSRQKASANGSEAERSSQVAKETRANRLTVKVAGQDGQESQTVQMKQLTPEEAQRLAASLKDMVNQSTEGLVEVQHADGSVSMDLQGRFQSVAVARVNEDGSVTQSCVDNPQAAGAFFGINPELIKDPSNKKAIKTQPNVKVVNKQR